MPSIQDMNILTESRKSFKNNDDSLFNYLKNEMFQTIKSFKYAYTAILYKDSDKRLGLVRTQRSISELHKLRKELVEMKEYWEKEIKKVIFADGDDVAILHKQMKKFNKMMIGFFIEIKQTILKESRKVNYYHSKYIF